MWMCPPQRESRGHFEDTAVLAAVRTALFKMTEILAELSRTEPGVALDHEPITAPETNLDAQMFRCFRPVNPDPPAQEPVCLWNRRRCSGQQLRISPCVTPELQLPHPYGTFLVLFTLAYKLSPLHPLAKYPGPIIAKSSKWWAAYVSGQGDLHRHYQSLHDRYGDVVRVGPNELSIRDPSFIPAVLGQGGLPKGPYWDNRPGSVVSQRDPVKHLHQRKPWNRAFSSAAVKEYEDMAAKRTKQLIGCLEGVVHQSGGNKGVVLDMASWFNYFSLFSFGGGFELMKAGGDNDGLRAPFQPFFRIRAIMGHISYILPLLLSTTGRKCFVQRVHAFSRERVVKKDLFYHLSRLQSGEAMPEDERPSLTDVAKDGSLAIVAGADTTSGALTATLYYLLCNPIAYDRLRAEVNAAFPTGEELLDVTKISQMEWLNGCIAGKPNFGSLHSNESLRLQPPIPSGSQRSVNKGAGEKVLGIWVIPEGTQVTLRTYTIQRDSRHFHSPETFLPERWFSTDSPAGEHNPAAFVPFSYGPANCAGKNLA
ncbi:high nitrogen upregulated cytochrome P450 monooxygenase 2 [Lactarius akahatsu]|uniref:High nitrogen upregulated cytochrome P450 monooxygenase 2 n=1 Tax=Lactarius akahatsu TaxID=416441 RepID=A0AAD4Q8B2_9AGAM|nr:high nitrogen upregulated cytochrome P450 monooxygenase 2 [Lactarius akahatsu]